jgi:hypothetical protein
MNNKLFRTLDVSFGWLAFLIAMIVYSMTVAPSLSFWDCGEFISASYKLEVGHPPGAPLYLLFGRLFAMFAPDVTQVAFMVNMLSVMASAFTILFLYWTIAYFAKRMIAPDGNYSVSQTVAIIAASLIGAIAFTFSDTFWFSAVEAEVYALSSFFTAIVFWAMLKWSEQKDDVIGLRWILLICLLVGMSIGVHLLNLLALPAIVMIYYYRKFPVTKLGVVIALAVSMLIIAIVMWGIIPGTVIVASKFELFTVNTLGLSYNSGLLLWAFATILVLAAGIYVTGYVKNKIINYIVPSLGLILISVPFIGSNTLLHIIFLAGMIWGIVYLSNKRKDLLNFVMLAFTMIMIGYSCYATIVIRSNVNPPMDQNNPEDVFNLLYYLNREQYGSNPLLHGQYYNARVVDYLEGDPIYVQRDGKYEIVGHRQNYVYEEEHTTLFPRMYSSDPQHIEVYQSWGGIRPTQKAPSFSNNIKFFVNYQFVWMYWRYFMWNFSGRQNDFQGHGNIIHGNWISGIPFIDNPRLGDQSKLPDYLKNNKANNKYYMLPLLLGLLGLGYHLFKRIKDWTVTMLLFLLTGFAIIVFLNQTPFQPRERDYAYVGSFYAFAIWIGLGVIGLYELIRKYIPGIAAAGIAGLICLPVPIMMASENWDDHDRTNRYIARDFAHNYLASCSPNSILFTYGDNDTFPVWYAQNVEGIGLDVKVACLPYFASDWYVDQMKQATYEADPMPLTFERRLYEPSIRDVLYRDVKIQLDKSSGAYQIVPESSEHISVDSLMNFIAHADKKPLEIISNSVGYYYHKNNVFLRIDSATVVNNGLVKSQDANLIEDVIVWSLDRDYLVKNEMMTLDMLRTNNWERPVHFTSIGSQNTLGLDSYMQNEGATFKLVPIKSTAQGRIDTEILYDNYMNKFKWGNMNDPEIYLDETIRRTIRVVRVRQNFQRLAQELIAEGDVVRAKEVMERAEELMPTNLHTPNLFDIEFATPWYQIEEFERGDRFLEDVANVCIQELDFFYSLEESQFRSVETEVQMAMETYRRVLRNLATYQRLELYDKLEPKFDEFMMHFERRMRF